MELNEKLQLNIEKTSVLLAYELQENLGTFDHKTFEYIQYAIYCALIKIANEAAQGNNNATK